MIRSDSVARTLARCAAACLLVGAVGSTTAWGADEAAARALFAEGRRLAASGDYAAACPKFEDSYRLDPGIGTSFNLADCFEHIGRTASAWARFMDVAAATRAAGQTEREKVARSRAEALQPKLSRLVVVVNAALDGLTVTRDGTTLTAAAWGLALPVDPGAHTIQATAPGRRPWSSTVTVPDGGGDVRVEVPVLADLPPPQPAVAAAVPVIASPPKMTDAPPRRSSRPVAAAITLGTVGLAGLIVGTTFGIKFLLANNELENVCAAMPNACPAPSIARYNSLHADALRDRTYELVGFGAGSLAIAAAAYLWWHAAPEPAASATQVSLIPAMTTTACGAALFRRF